MTHRNAPLSETGRLRVARCVVEDGWAYRAAAERFQVSVSTVGRWVSRYREQGVAGMADRSSRPHRCPAQTPTSRERRIITLRVLRRWGPARIGFHLGVPASTVHRVLTRYRMPRLAHLDRATGALVRRYEHPTPGDLIHIDIKKISNIPDPGGPTLGRARRRNRQPATGYGYLHNAIDDHSRLAYTEYLPDETAATATAFFHRARAFFTEHGITIHRILTDNGPCYRARQWQETLSLNDITHKRTRPHRPQTNGKVERYNRTLLTEWAYARHYTTNTERLHALTTWLHTYNHHRPHTALNGQPPTSRVPNLPRHNSW